MRSVEEMYWEKDELQKDRVEQFIIEFDADVVEVDGDGMKAVMTMMKTP